MQLTTFRKNAKNIAEEGLKAQNKTLGKGKKRKRSVLNPDAFEQGRKDSKRIDLKQFNVEPLRIGYGTV